MYTLDAFLHICNSSILRVFKRWTIFRPTIVDEVAAAGGIAKTNEVLKDPKPICHICHHYKHHLGKFKVHPFIQKIAYTPLKSQMI
jgi:hypothetical protein